MKRLIFVILAAVAPFVVRAAEEPQIAYVAHEVQFETFGQVSTSDLDTGRGSYGFGVAFFATESLGFGARTTFDELGGHTFENISPRVLWRIPVGGRHALYAFGQGTRTFHGDTGWSVEAGPGYEYRIGPVGAYVEIGMRKEVAGQRRSTDTFGMGEAGVRFSF